MLVISVGTLLALVGCRSGDRPELGEVSGKVTLDGKPLAGVIISFQPESGRAGSAETDQEGNYTLIYRYGVNGAKVGPNTVSFAWPTGAEDKPPLPAKYTGNTELKREVTAGSNKFDFELKTE